MANNIVDITPHPAILAVLGEIEFKPWQCIAELMDNSIDSFLNAMRDGQPIDTPCIRIAFGRDTVVVKDNGPGMSLFELEMAVKAGWTTHDRFTNLGLYGVGFNIASARLGMVTTIWTTRAGDEQWYGLEIDLQKIARNVSYKLPVKTRSKSEHQNSGTEIEITGLKSDWSGLFTNSTWIRNQITKRLERVYSTMLRIENPQPIGFILYINDKRVSAWEHCVWPSDWDVYRKNEGLVRPIQEIDISFGTKYVSRSTGEVYELLDTDSIPSEDILKLTERVYGWVGIQRYADENDFGIDILRNGRKIEIGCKDLFRWEDGEGNTIMEYPIDDPRFRGRIVGELHLDHGYVHYTKHRFEREHISWKHLLRAARHDEPLIKRGDFGYEGPNTSPLGLLFRTFRRNSPYRSQTYWDILFIKENDKAKDWANEFRKGIKEFRDNSFWKEEIEKQDRVDEPEKVDGGDSENVDNGENVTDDTQDGDFILDGGLELGSDDDSSDMTGEGNSANDGKEQHLPDKQRTPIDKLNLKNIAGLGASGKTYSLEVYKRETGSTNSTQAWSGRLTERNVYEIEVDPDHPIFQTSTFQIQDATLADFAFMVTSEEMASLGTTDLVSYAGILSELRSKYASLESLEINRLIMDIDNLRLAIAKLAGSCLTETKQAQLLEYLPSEDVDRIRLDFAGGPKTVAVVQYFKLNHIAKIFKDAPTILFEIGCFNREWSPESLQNNPKLLEQHQNRLIQDIWILFAALSDFLERSQTSSNQSITYRSYIRQSLNRLREFLSKEALSD